MQIDLPDETIAAANRLATADDDAAAVIVKAIQWMAWERQEVAAVQEGIDDYKQGRHRPFDEFVAEFMAERGIVTAG